MDRNTRHNIGQRAVTARMLAGHGITVNPSDLTLQSCRGDLRSLGTDLAVYAHDQIQWVTVIDRAGNSWPLDSLHNRPLPCMYEGAAALEVFIKKTGRLTVISR